MVKINGEEKEIAGKNLLEYLKEAGFEPERVVVERNLEIVPKEQLINVYIPDIFGKEKRKSEPSKEGKLGVEGVKSDVIIDALKKAGVKFDVDAESPKKTQSVTKTDLFLDGLSGGKDSAEKRARFLKQLDLPEHLSANSMLKLINSFMDFDDYKREIQKLNEGVKI